MKLSLASKKFVKSLSKQLLVLERTSVLFWCFLFFTLFNLQGTRRYLRNVAILSDFPAFVKHFFLLFQNQVFRTAALSDSLVRISRPPYKVNPFFTSFPKTRHHRVDTHGLHHFPLYSAALFAPTSPFPINRPYSSLVSTLTGTGSGA